MTRAASAEVSLPDIIQKLHPKSDRSTHQDASHEAARLDIKAQDSYGHAAEALNIYRAASPPHDTKDLIIRLEHAWKASALASAAHNFVFAYRSQVQRDVIVGAGVVGWFEAAMLIQHASVDVWEKRPDHQIRFDTIVRWHFAEYDDLVPRMKAVAPGLIALELRVRKLEADAYDHNAPVQVKSLGELLTPNQHRGRLWSKIADVQQALQAHVLQVASQHNTVVHFRIHEVVDLEEHLNSFYADRRWCNRVVCAIGEHSLLAREHVK